MSHERMQWLVERLRRDLESADPARKHASTRPIDPKLGLEFLESMLLARHLDRAAHELRASGHGHYTICGAGHESNVVLGRLTTPNDPSLIHYRSAALMIERARQVPEVDAVRDIALSLVASRDEPASGGRHKVFGNKKLGIIPQTSTIASHLPRAVGLGFALERRAQLGLTPKTRAIALASFGDASINHSTALGALNAAGWATHQSLPMPVLFVCEDNGLGISVRSPAGWVKERIRTLPQIRPFFARGSDVSDTYHVAAEAVEYCRATRRPAILHIECVRLLGHAGSDVDTTYRTNSELEQAFELDPVYCHAFALLAQGHATREQVLALDARASERVDALRERVKLSPRLESREAVMAPLTAPLAAHLREAEARPAERTTQASTEKLTLAQGINRALAEILERRPQALLFGEDVAKKGGVYGISKGLLDRFGPLRVFNTLLDEQTIVGLALGSATLGLLPVAEIQYLAYVHNAEDQLRGEAATFRFFSNGDYENPMLVRVAGLAYQKGFGGHFHNDNSLGVLRDIPGLVVAVPARADDALALLRAGAELAVEAGRVVVLVEPIALYHRRDLLTGDAAWLATDAGEVATLGRGRLYHEEARDLVIVTYGNGVAFSLAAARVLADQHRIFARVLDLRWICPLPATDILAHARATGRVLVVDECRQSGNPSEAIAALLLDGGRALAFRRVTGADSFIPLGEAADRVLLNEQEIVEAALSLMSGAESPGA